jgi:ATP-binding cassette subfamily B protein
MHTIASPFKSITAFLWHIIKPYRWWYLLMVQATVISSFYFIGNNYAIKLIVDGFTNNATVQYAQMYMPIAIFILTQLGLETAWRFSDWAYMRINPEIHRDIMLTAYDYIQHHDYTYFQNHQSGVIVSKLKGIIAGYDAIYTHLHHKAGKNFLTTIVCIGSLAFINLYIFLFMLIWSVLVAIVIGGMSAKLHHLNEALCDSEHRIIGRLSDNVTNIMSLFAFAKRRTEFRHAKTMISEEYIPKAKRSARYWCVLAACGSVLYCFMLISILIFTIWLQQHHLITPGDIIFVIMMAITIAFELWIFTCDMFDFMKTLGEFKASLSILATPHHTVDNPEAKAYTIHTPDIAFEHVEFGYEAHTPILHNFHITIPAGQKVGIVGHSGAGKSTIVNLLLKNFIPQSGHILIDGQPSTTITADSIRAQIALIPQDILLFHRSIGENIAYAKDDATFEEIQYAAKIAHIDTFIEGLPEKYDTLVGERGIKLSGGQRQRIAIARAVLKQAPIIILDEATSHLDTMTEQDIQKAIHYMLGQHNTTVIAIAHRLSTIRDMDRVIVMDAGRIIEDGSFKALMRLKQGYFKTLWDSQVNGMIV